MKYPKRYATVVRLDQESRLLWVKFDNNIFRIPIPLRNRRGYGSTDSLGGGCGDFPKGTRVKVFEKNGRYYFSKVGC